MPTSRTSSDASSSVSSKPGARASASNSEVSSSLTSVASSSSQASRLPASQGGSHRDHVEEKPNVIKSPHYAGRGGDIVDEEEAEPLLGSEVMTSSATASAVASSFAQSGFPEVTVDMELSPETRDRLNKFKETALQLALLALIVMVLGFVVWLIWSQREAFIAWWKHTFPPRCEFTDWSDWAACTKSCGVGSNSANRSYGPQKCKPIPGPSELQRKRQCELEECLKAVNCQLGPWSSWASCSEECGPGIQNRLRREIQAPNALGRPCPLAFQEWPCQNRLCSHFCRLSPWSPWGPCSTSCGRGKMTRHRTAIPRDEIQSGIECPKEVDESACSLGECIEQSSCHFEVAPRVDRAAPLKGCNGTTAEQGCHLNCAVGYEEDRPLLCAGGLRFLRSRCLPTSCGEAPTIVKGRPTFRCAGLQSGAMCHIDCDPGFQKTGDLFCHHGHFNVPDCRPDSCGRAPQPSHGAALFVCPSGGKSCSTTDLQERTVEDCTGLKYGEVCDFFTCRSGYFKSEELRCDRFNFNRPRCVEDLCRKGPPEVAHAVVDFDDGVAKECRFLEYHRLSFPSRAVCPVSCDEGFQAHGASFCVRGQWYAAECVQAGVPPVGCKGLGAPQVKNAAAVLCPKDLYYTSQVCEVKCDNGFRKTADLLCAPDGWLDAECLPAECRAPIVDNAEDLSLCAGSPHGSQCRVRCLEGFEASADHLVCDHGVWSYVLCEPRRCRHPPGAPPFAVGNFSACAGKLHGEYCKLTCEDGFDPVPSDGMRCERGRFSAAACEPRACPMPLVNNSGDLSDCFQHPSGSICELLCARGYVKAGANLYCDRGKWSPGACWPTPGCGAPPTVAHAESAEIRHCVNVARGERCDGFRCDVGFEAAAGESLSCLKHGAFSRPHCIRQRCGKPTLPPNGRGSQGCEGVPSGGVCRLLCKEGFAPRAAFHCLRGTFLESRCDLVRGLNSYAEDESLTLALHLEVPFSEWTNSEVSKPAGVRAARLSRAIAQAAGLRPWRLVAKNARPYSLSSTVLDLIMLPASYSEDDLEFEDFQRGAGLRPPPAFIALQRAQEALQNQSDQLQRALRLPGRATKILVKQLEVVSNTVGKMCSHPPVIEHAKDLSECAFTLSGHVCPLVCEAGFVHSGGLACQDGEWLLPHCVELGCDSVPVVAHAEDLSHCKNSASGSLCSIDCQPGFLRTGDIECRRGVWGGASCLPKTCNHVPSPLHADAWALRQCQGLANGSECALQCEPGYLPTGSGRLLCHLGNFQIHGHCKPADCLHAPSVRNSLEKLTSCVGLKHGSACDFECRPGYKKVGWLQCFYGRFTSARCEPGECKAPPVIPHLPQEEAERCAPWPSGKRCNATCSFPRRMLPELSCSSGHWSSSKCVPYSDPGGQPCRTLPVLPRVADLGHCTGLPHGAVCKASCIEGYSLDRPLICLDGLWSQASCEPLPCGQPPAVESASSTAACHGQDHGSLCLLFCRSGFSPGGLPQLIPGDISSGSELQAALARRSLRCHAGEWQNPGCLEAPCSQPPAVPGATAASLRACVGMKSRSLCRFDCAGGFVAAGYPECIKGEWSSLDLAKCEEAPCSDIPKVRHAKDTRACAGRKSGEICPLECLPGYQLISELRCERGVWLSGKCMAYCGLPTEAIGGAISLEHCVDTPVGDSCAVVCQPGLHPTGRIRCLPGGRWSEARCFDPAKELMHEAVARLNVEGLRDFCDYVAADVTKGLEVVASSFEHLLAKHLKVPLDLFTSNLTEDPSFSRTGFRLELKVLCSEMQKAAPLAFQKLSDVPGLPAARENDLRAFSDCDRKLELVNQTLTSTSMKEFRSNICATFCDTSQESMCQPECLDRVLGFLVLPKTMLLQVLEESSPGTSFAAAARTSEEVV